MKNVKVILAILLAALLLVGCSESDGGKVPVQAISMICSIGNVGLQNRYAGVVSAQNEITIEKDENREVTEILVKEGDTVKAGQVLFKYDVDQAKLMAEKAELELEQIKADIKDKQSSRSQLEKEKKKVSKDEQLSYTLEIQACDTAIREGEYNQKLKEKELEHLRESLGSTSVSSPVNGSVISMNTDGQAYDTNGQRKPYITLSQSGTYRVSAYLNENNAAQIIEGAPVRILSRVDDGVWTGTISSIDWEHPVNSMNNGGVVYEGSEMTTSSNYPFYIELETSEGLLLGQHVYVEMASGTSDKDPNAIYLPSCYLVDFTENGAFVWAQSQRGRLEKRAVTLGAYEAETDTYAITEGLTAEDFIAFPDDTLEEGMKCVTFDESAFEADENAEDYTVDGLQDGEAVGFEDGEPMPSEDIPEDMIEGEALPTEDMVGIPSEEVAPDDSVSFVAPAAEDGEIAG